MKFRESKLVQINAIYNLYITLPEISTAASHAVSVASVDSNRMALILRKRFFMILSDAILKHNISHRIRAAPEETKLKMERIYGSDTFRRQQLCRLCLCICGQHEQEILENTWNVENDLRVQIFNCIGVHVS